MGREGAIVENEVGGTAGGAACDGAPARAGLSSQDVRLLAELGIPVYPDGRVEASRVLQLCRERLSLALEAEGQAGDHQPERRLAPLDFVVRLERLEAQFERLADAVEGLLATRPQPEGEWGEVAGPECPLVEPAGSGGQAPSGQEGAEQDAPARRQVQKHWQARFRHSGSPVDGCQSDMAPEAAQNGESLCSPAGEADQLAAPAPVWAVRGKDVYVRFVGDALLPFVRLRAKRCLLAAVGPDGIVDAPDGQGIVVRGGGPGVPELARMLGATLAGTGVQAELVARDD